MTKRPPVARCSSRRGRPRPRRPPRVQLSREARDARRGRGVIAIASGGPSPFWYLTRGTGTVTLILLTLSLALGVAGVHRLSSPRVPRFVIDAVQRNASLLPVAFLWLSRHRCGQSHGDCGSWGRRRVIGPQVSSTSARAALAEWNP